MDEVRDAPPTEREKLLVRSCAGNGSLRADVEMWLAAMEAGGTSLVDAPADVSVPDLVSRLSLSAPDDPRSRRVGPWRLVEEVGRGGSGVVWRAVRADGAYDQTVALKLLWGRGRSSELERRFETERRILAPLEHPNIARLIDGGVIDAVPYLVMEYVDGEPITSWCETRGASLDERLDLFLSICDAIGYAHRSLVVHRDLKPSNVLVTRQGVPKIVDFGVAKLLVEEEAGAILETRIPMWTPAYAAPEQIRGQPVTTATDIWALGAILYRLLTGREARRIESFTPAAMEAAASAEPNAPSAHARVGATGIPAKRIAGDLDAIVTTAMRPEPEKRYASGAELAADLRRHRSNLPVEAREPPPGYRLWKFTRRNRAAVSVAAALLLGASLYGVTLRVQADRLAAERDRSRLEAARAKSTMSFLGDLILAAGPMVETQVRTSADLVDLAIARTDSAFAGSPRIRAEILTRLGTSAYWMGQLPEAHDLFRHAAAVSESPGSEDVDPETAWLALLYLGSTQHQLGNYGRAEAAYENALRASNPVFGEISKQTGRTHNAIGWLDHETGRLDRAEASYRRSLEARREAEGPESAGYATTLENLGLLWADRGHLEAAESYVRTALDIRRRVYGAWHVNTAYSLRSLGRILHRRGRVQEGESLLRTAVSMRLRMLGPHHHKYAEDLVALAVAVGERGAWLEARDLLREGMAIRRASLGSDHPVTALTAHQLATVHHRLGQTAEADSLYRSAIDFLTPAFGAEHPWTLAVRTDFERLGEGDAPLAREWLSGTRLPAPIDVDPGP